MLNLKVELDNCTIPMQTLEDLRTFLTFCNSYLALIGNVQPVQDSLAVPAENTQVQEPEISPQQESSSQSPQNGRSKEMVRVPVTEDISPTDWIVVAIQALGGRATGREIYNQMLKMGYKPKKSVKHPLEATKVRIAAHRNFVWVETKENFEKVWQYSEEGRKYQPTLETLSNPQFKHGKYNPALGERVIDFAARAAETLNQDRVTPEQLVQQMYLDGWKTDSVQPDEVVRAALRRNPDVFERVGENLWAKVKADPDNNNPALPLEESAG